ncbi:cytochrome P450 [Rhizophagus irregularis DAOM 181602=DAOM 197198]|uniref:Cytochrome P450 n=1 Tax=Rhizophagus irregularis (strain DAOM 181602 / DAOM 197198 / MUCL 43194) TaxID=747089 RepID=A0A2P4Q523_RHIID|nr:cytochrome P450 [Rhizophagus irregularis DAOM 181602=DAOM 197198]POG72751.1 cytochrome P450 [Rhizophagus irregularis DAOM 181602=DAOM 197198]|eukprot:XP_025179617.1 cytochrome P450 [Rhizophagus irregularis DAOM 181602=DAOM 197198]
MLDLISLVGFFILGIIGWATYKIYIWPVYITPLRKIPGPPSESLFYGNFKTIMTEERTCLKWVQKYGNIIKHHEILNQPALLILDTKIIQDILLNHVYDFIRPPYMLADAIAIAGRGLVFAEGENHKRQRKMMNPAFIHNNIKEMVPTFIRVAFTLKSLIEDKVNLGESEINLTSYLSKATLDVIGLVGFNYDFNSLTSSNELAEAYESLTNAPNSALRIGINYFSSFIPSIREIPIDINKQFKNGCAVIDRVSKKLVEEKYKAAESGELKGKDLLSLLININKTLPIEEKMTDNELKYQIMTFLLAGHETTSVSTSWALYFLSKYPHMQDLLREELVKAFPDKSKFNPTFDEINSLEYLNCVVKETLRLNPPVGATSRLNTKDEVFGGYHVPKNTVMIIAISTLHRLPEIWGPTAAEFDPKRWLDPSLIKNVTNFNYLPFLAGTRACIGNKVALTEFKILLSMLIRNFVFKPIEGFNIKRRFIPLDKPDPYLGLSVSKVEN